MKCISFKSKTGYLQIAAVKITSLGTEDYSIGRNIELHAGASASDVIKIDANSLVTAVTEVQDDIGEITSLDTTDKSDIVSAINEHEDDLGWHVENNRIITVLVYLNNI